jgi:hypothetical protein
MMLRSVTTAGLVAAVFLLTAACSQTGIKAYQGPEQPAGQTALIQSGAYTELVAVDGQQVKTQRNVAVLPGRHTVQIKIVESQEPMYNEYWYTSYMNGDLHFTAQPGHTYQVSISFVPSPFPLTGSQDSGFRWLGYVTDRTVQRVVARTDYLPVQVYPRVPYTLRAGP